MYAIVNIGGFQYKVQKEMSLKVPLMDQEREKLINFDDVLLISDGDDIKIGHPYIEGARVKAEVLDHGKHRKVMVVKKKRRKGYRRKKGHRQDYTEIKITDILTNLPPEEEPMIEHDVVAKEETAPPVESQIETTAEENTTPPVEVKAEEDNTPPTEDHVEATAEEDKPSVENTENGDDDEKQA